MAGINLAQLNAGQRDVVARLDEPLFVAAGAGSGKTFTLTARLVHALSEGSAADGGRFLDSVDQALVITFTEAAALEIKERVRQALRAAGDDDAHLREQSLRVDGAWISTIHGMCSRILHRHAIELGIDPEFEVCDGSVADALMARALDEVMSEVQQEDAYAFLRGEYPLWTQSAGSVVGMIGVLRAEASKCPGGFDDFVCPSSHEAASEMERLIAMFESLASLTLTEKQRAVVDGSLQRIAPFLQLPPGERTAARVCELTEGIKVPDLRKADQKPLKEEAKEQLALVRSVAHFERVQELCPQVVALARAVDERYTELKRERSYLDNDDLITYALAAVEGHPEVMRDYADRFRMVMVDEFQDTDERQLRLISLLAGKDACHLTTVGDAQQSIYRFRGGDVEVFRARGRSLGEGHHVAMDVNYRSDHNVLGLVERVCGDAGLLGDFLKLAGDAGRRGKLVAGDACRIQLELACGGNAELMSATNAAQIADRLAQLRDQGQPVGSMALLLGTTSRVDLYLDALRAHGLTAVVSGGSSFTRTPEVGVIQALLHTLANPHDTETGLFRLLSSDMFRLDGDDFCQLGSRRQDVLDAPTKRAIEQCFVTGDLTLFGDAKPSLRLARAHEVLCRAYGRLSTWRLADVCQAVVEESGWLLRLEREGVDGLAVAANVLAAVRYVRDLTETLGLGVARAAFEFDRWLEAAKLTPANLVGDELDAVRVMTAHGSKGLQFPVTAVAECWGNPSVSSRLAVGRIEGRCIVCLAPGASAGGLMALLKPVEAPHDPKGCSSVAEWASYLVDRELAAEAGEKARLLYVALTRAEEALVVGIPLSDKDAYLSQLAAQMVSAFPELDELVAGECELEVTPERPIELERSEDDGQGGKRRTRECVEAARGKARIVQLQRPPYRSHEPWQASCAGTLAGFDGELPAAASEVATLGADASVLDAREEHFELFDLGQLPLARRGWRAREGVFSYSSAHAAMEQAAATKGQAAGTSAGRGLESTSSADVATAAAKRADAQAGPVADDGAAVRKVPKMPPTPPRAEQEAEAEGAAYTPDADKATNLGSAFHELAQTMVETGRDHSPERLEALARTWHLSVRQTARLREAIARWEGCELRREAQTYELLRAEVPFFVRVDSDFGDHVEGAIDLLACDRGGTCALVVDYKTGDRGLTLAEIEERHRMQANFYAWVLMSQGFEEVECAFACVELDDEHGGPIVVRYAFDKDNPPAIG